MTTGRRQALLGYFLSDNVGRVEDLLALLTEGVLPAVSQADYGVTVLPFGP